MRLLIVGCGYVGKEVSGLLAEKCEIWALTRSRQRAVELEQLQIRPVIGHWLDDRLTERLPEFEAVLVSVPHRPDRGHEETTHCRGLQHLCQWLPRPPGKLIYLSTTGVYGDCDQGSVDEDTPPSPTRLGPQIAIAAERWLTEAFPKAGETAWAFTILRLAGIYGPGRIPLADRIRGGEPLAVPRSGYLNLVHVVDIARMIDRVLDHSLVRSDYVFSDGQPVPRGEFYSYLAELCDVGPPRYIDPSEDDSRARRAGNKRIDPRRLVGEVQFAYAYPDYRAGLRQALQFST